MPPQAEFALAKDQTMTIEVDAVYLDGVLCPKAPLEIPNGTEVRLAVDTCVAPIGDSKGATRDADAAIERLRSFRGMLNGMTREQLVADRRQGLL